MPFPESLFPDGLNITPRIRELLATIPSLTPVQARLIAEDEYKRQYPRPVGNTFRMLTTRHGNIAILLSRQAVQNGTALLTIERELADYANDHQDELRWYESGNEEWMVLDQDVDILTANAPEDNDE